MPGTNPAPASAWGAQHTASSRPPQAHSWPQPLSEPDPPRNSSHHDSSSARTSWDSQPPVQGNAPERRNAPERHDADRQPIQRSPPVRPGSRPTNQGQRVRPGNVRDAPGGRQGRYCSHEMLPISFVVWPLWLTDPGVFPPTYRQSHPPLRGTWGAQLLGTPWQGTHCTVTPLPSLFLSPP